MMLRRLAVLMVTLLYSLPLQAADKLVLQLRWDNQYQFAGYYAAQWMGFYEQAGLDVEIRSAITPDRSILNVVEEVVQGRADIGISAADILVARDRGAPLVILSSVFQQSPVGVISRRDVQVSSPADLMALRLRHVDEDLTSVEMRAMMLAEGLDINQAQEFSLFDPDQHAQPFTLLAQNEIDAYPGYVWTALWRAKQEGLDVSVLKPSAYGIDFYGDSLFTTERFADDRPEVVKRFVQASMLGWEYALNNKDVIASKIARTTERGFPISDFEGFNRFQAQEVAKLTLYPLISLGHTNAERWRRMHETLKRFGMITGNFDERALIFDPDRRDRERLSLVKDWLVWGVASVGAVIAMILLWNYMLRRQINSATHKLQRAHHELEERVQERTQELNAMKNRLSSAFNAIDEAVWDWNVQTKEVIVSSNWPKMFGLSDDEVEPHVQTWIDRLHPDELSMVMQRVEEHFEGRSSAYTSEHHMLHKDGRWLWVLDRGKVIEWDENGRPSRMVGAVLDITQRKEAEDALRKLSRAVDQSPSAIFITDTEGTIEYTNAKFTELTGFSPEEALGRNPRIIKSGDTPAELIEDLWETIKAGREWRGEIKDRRKDGKHFWAYETIAPVKDDNGRVTHFVATHEDITKRKDAELAVKEALKEADVANRAKSELMANMSHELRTPLNAIIGFSNTIREEVFGPVGHDKYREYVEDISSSGEHLLELISDILNVSAIEVGKLELHEEPIDVGKLTGDTLRLVQHRADDGGVKLESELPDAMPPLYADSRRMKQILLNLLSNAVKFTPEQGKVTISVTSGQDGQFIFTISDTGVGMTKTELAKAMLPFGQVRHDSATIHEGTGLGLPLSKGLIELHDGTLRMISEKGKGTQAIVTLPANRTM